MILAGPNVPHVQPADPPVTAACDRCGKTTYLTGNIWPHANGLLLCGGPA